MGHRIGIIDVYYPRSGGARAALAVYPDETMSDPIEVHTDTIDHVNDYMPGEFYQRELPPIEALLSRLNDLDLLIIDGYVDLSPDGKPGLGAHLYLHFPTIPIVGIAKNPYLSATHAARVYRGDSRKPLYVTSTGMSLSNAAEIVRNMKGASRIPSAVRHVDRLSRCSDALKRPL